MKRNTTELNVDFIGGQSALTKDEEKAISDYLKGKKKKERSRLSPKSSTRNEKVTA